MPSASSSGGKERHDTKAELAKKKRDYQAKARDPSTEEEIVDGAELETAYFGEGIWRPSWGNVEFVSPGPGSAYRRGNASKG